MSYFIYNHSIIGNSHKKKNTECQDANTYRILDNGWIVAAVADGLGSAKNSQIGSKIAVKTVVDFIAENMPLSYRENGIKRAIYLGFNAALKKIIKQSVDENNALESYDTTLSVVVYNGIDLYYGHSGDGGIFGLTLQGDYVEITTPVKGNDGYTVVPLSHGEDTWYIDAYREDITSVLLVTDGIRDAIRPYELGKLPSDVYVPICAFLMHPSWYMKHPGRYDEIVLEYLECRIDTKIFYELLEDVYKNAIMEREMAEEAWASVKRNNFVNELIYRIDDDKTALAIINTHKDREPDLKAVSYYSEPNWKQKKEKTNAVFYPQIPKTTGIDSSVSVAQSQYEDVEKRDIDSDEQLGTNTKASMSSSSPNTSLPPKTKNCRKKNRVILLVIISIILIISSVILFRQLNKNTATNTEEKVILGYSSS